MSGKKGFFGEFIENIKQDFDKNKEMKVSKYPVEFYAQNQNLFSNVSSSSLILKVYMVVTELLVYLLPGYNAVKLYLGCHPYWAMALTFQWKTIHRASAK